MDFSFNGFFVGFMKVDEMDVVMVIVEMFMKYIVFVVVPIIYIVEIATELFYRSVMKYFRVSFDVISDCDVRLITRF